jgi:PAS domain-containing protein
LVSQSLPIITHRGVFFLDPQQRRRASHVVKPDRPISCPDPQLLWSSFIAAMHDHALLLDPAGRILAWNRGAELIKGCHADDVIGWHFSCLYTVLDTVMDGLITVDRTGVIQ